MTPKALKRKMTIMVADDHTLVIEGLRALINREFDMEVIATVTSGKDLLDELQYTRPDLVVLDVQMQGYDGFQCLAEIRQRALPLKVVMLSAAVDSEALQNAWELQADGYALKTDPPRQTIEVIRNVGNGQLVFPRSMRQSSPAASTRTKLLDCLTERERDVLRLIADGQTNAQIAILLCVQESTAKFHVQNILHKLGATNRTEAAQIYFRESYSGGK